MKRRNTLQLILGAIGAVHTKRELLAPKTAAQSRFVGAWHLQAVGAPILHHGFFFHADGTVCSVRADAGSALESGSSGAGVWGESVGKNQAQGAFLEFRYARDTHEYQGYVRVEFVVSLSDDAQTLDGQAHSRIFDATGRLLTEVWPTWSAQRITLQ